MAKQKKEVETHLIYNPLDKKIKASFFHTDSLNVNDVSYYKDQSSNPLFMSMKEDLVREIKKEKKSLLEEMKAETSNYKKQLIQMDIDEIECIELNFVNTWEQLEFTDVLFYNRDDISKEEIKQKQMMIRKDIKYEVLTNIYMKDNFIKKYMSFLFSHPLLHVLGFPFIIFAILYILMLTEAPWYYNAYDYVFYFLEYIFTYYAITVLSAIAFWPIIQFINEKLISKIMGFKEQSKEPERRLRRNITSIIKPFIVMNILKRIFRKPKDY